MSGTSPGAIENVPPLLRGVHLSASLLQPPSGIAKACEQNLLKTFKFGGRCEFPTAVELQALVVSS